MQNGARALLAAGGLALFAAPASAGDQAPQAAPQSISSPQTGDPFAIFTPTTDPIRHKIDYTIWDYALRQMVLPMGPSARKTARRPDPILGTRTRQGHNSRYRLEGSLVMFVFLDRDVIASLTEYREDLERVGTTLDISKLPRNEQLAFWINLHNVAMVEQLALNWPVRQPREIEIDGVLLDDAKFIEVSGVGLSLRDIRENIVYAHWRSPKVIYGFWRGEIGGPALEPMAFTGDNVSSLLDNAAADFINSLRGTQKNGNRLDVSSLYEEVSAFYFRDFNADLRAHIAQYANEDVTDILAQTSVTRASITEWDIADVSGGARQASYLFSSEGSARIPAAMARLLAERSRKLFLLEKEDVPTGRVIFSNIDLPGDPPNKNAVE